MLQWGRGRMAPENGINLLFLGAYYVLQWGRGRMAPENQRACGPEVLAYSLLQWGRGRMAPENRILGNITLGDPRASMGPGPDGPGKPRRD